MRLFWILLIGISFIGCSKDIDYQFIVNNQTIYDIDKMTFEFGANTENTLSIKSFKTTPIFILNCNGKEIANPISLHYMVLNYSTVDSSYTNNIGHMLSRKSLSEGSLNTIIIETMPSTDGDIFKTRVQ